jgi:hypothetical protein
MFVKIEDAPFTEEEKKAILNLGIVIADWGHPTVVLDDPVKYFTEKQASRKMTKPTEDQKPPRWMDEETNPFGV